MQKILVPVDFSEDSINALEHAIRWANLIEANVRLIHVKPNKFFKRELKKKSVPQNDEALFVPGSDLVDMYKDKYTASGIFDVVSRKGRAYAEIAQQVDTDNTDLVIMGTHGASGADKFWAGSNAFRTVSQANCPVITIRKSFEPRDLKRIVLPIKLPEKTMQKVPFVTEIARIFGAEIFLLAVQDMEIDDQKAKLKENLTIGSEYIRSKGVVCHQAWASGDDMSDLTIDYAKKVDADLIGIMTKRKPKKINYFVGTFAQDMVNHSPVPVMCVHPNYNQL